MIGVIDAIVRGAIWGGDETNPFVKDNEVDRVARRADKGEERGRIPPDIQLIELRVIRHAARYTVEGIVQHRTKTSPHPGYDHFHESPVRVDARRGGRDKGGDERFTRAGTDEVV